jgi:hemoglobin-like flavoprotein
MTPDQIEPVQASFAKAVPIADAAYGVEAADYKPVGEALIWTLGKGLGDDFAPDVRDAWIAAYGALSGVTIAAAYGAEAMA